MIRVKYICEIDGFKMYYSESGNFFKTFFSETFDSSDPEIGALSYGSYFYTGSKEWYIPDE